MGIKAGDIVKGRTCGTFRVRNLRKAGGCDGADLLEVHPITLEQRNNMAMFLPLNCIVPAEQEQGPVEQ